MATVTPESSKAEKPVYSRPIFRQRLEIKSLSAQKVMTRLFERLSEELTGMNVVLTVNNLADAIDPVEQVMDQAIQETARALDEESARMKALMDEHGVQSLPDYTHPVQYELPADSPQAAQFIGLVKKLDVLIVRTDALWLNGALSGSQHMKAERQWFGALMTLAGQIGGVTRAARKAVLRRAGTGAVPTETAAFEPEETSSADLSEGEPVLRKKARVARARKKVVPALETTEAVQYLEQPASAAGPAQAVSA